MRSRIFLYLLWICPWELICGQAHNVMVYPGSSEPEDHQVDQDTVPLNHSDVFEATEDWQPIRPGQVVPGGLHYRMNLATGTKEAKLLSPQAESVAKIDDDHGTQVPVGPPDNLRTYAELQDILAKNKLKMNTEFEQVDSLVQTYGNSSAEEQLVILDDLEYLLHQYDNARDFVHIGGMDKIVKPALASSEPSVRTQAALIFAAGVQSHPLVQDQLLLQSWMQVLLDQIARETEVSVSVSLVHALSCFIRGHTPCLEAFIGEKGFNILKPKLIQTSDLKLKLKILTLFADLSRDHIMEDAIECDQIVTLCGDLLSAERLDVLDRVISIVSVFQKPCYQPFQSLIPQFQKVRIDLEARNIAEELEMEATIEAMDKIISQLAVKSSHSEL